MKLDIFLKHSPTDLMRRFLKCRQVTVKCVLTRDSLNVQDGSYFMKVDQWRHNTANDGVPGQLGIYTREKRKTLGTGLHTEVTRGFFTSYTRTPRESERHDCTCNRADKSMAGQCINM